MGLGVQGGCRPGGPGRPGMQTAGRGDSTGEHWVRKRRRRLFLEVSSGAVVSTVRNEAETQF